MQWSAYPKLEISTFQGLNWLDFGLFGARIALFCAIFDFTCCEILFFGGLKDICWQCGFSCFSGDLVSCHKE